MRLHWYMLFLCLALYGCVVRSTDDQRTIPEDIGPPVEMSVEDVPIEIRTVCELITHKLRGSTTRLPAGLSFAPQGKHTVQDSGFPYKDAAFKGLDIISYETKPLTGDTALAGLVGVLYFAHKDGRKIAVAFVARYEVSPTSITILQSRVEPMPPATP